MIVVHLNIGQQSKIIAFGQTIKMRLEISVQRTFARSFIKSCGVSLISEQLDAIALENRSLRRQRSVFFIFAGQLARREFAGFNVRLIEWIDADDRTGDSGRDFPTKKFLAEIVNVVDCDAHDWLARVFNRLYRYVRLSILRSIPIVIEAQINKHTVIGIGLGRCWWFAIHRNQTLAVLSRRLCQQLLQPGAEIVNARRCDDRNFVPPLIMRDAEQGAEDNSGIVSSRDVGATNLYHLVCSIQELRDVNTHCGRGRQAEIRKRRVAPADTRYSQKYLAEAIGFGLLAKLRSGIGNGDEAVPHFVVADNLPDAVEKILFEDIRLESRA